MNKKQCGSIEGYYFAAVYALGNTETTGSRTSQIGGQTLMGLQEIIETGGL